MLAGNGTRLVVRRGFRITKLSIMIRRLLELLHLIKPKKPRLQQTDVSGSASRKPNPYQLVYWRSDWSESKTRRNNTKYWEFEIEHNGLRLP
jgi:hypothetical protein